MNDKKSIINDELSMVNETNSQFTTHNSPLIKEGFKVNVHLKKWDLNYERK